MNEHQKNHCLRTDSSLSHWRGLNAFYWYQIVAHYYGVVKTQNYLARIEGF